MVRGRVEGDEDIRAWLGGYIVADLDEGATVVGTGGYKGPPDDDGTVEIGYSIVPAYHRRGIGTAFVNVLVERAFADPRVKTVAAETLDGLAASRALLERCGFREVMRRNEPGVGDVLSYALHRPG